MAYIQQKRVDAGVPQPVVDYGRSLPQFGRQKLVAFLNGVDGVITLDDLPLYSQFTDSMCHCLIMRSPAPMANYWVAHSSADADGMPSIAHLSNTSGNMRSVVRNATPTLLADANGTAATAFQDGDWHVIFFTEDESPATVGRFWYQVDKGTLEGPNADTYTRWANDPIMSLVTVGGFRRNDPAEIIGCSLGEIAYYAAWTNEMFTKARHDAIVDAFHIGGGKEDLQIVTAAIQASIVGTGVLQFAGPLDGSPAHVTTQGQPVFENISFVPANFYTAIPSKGAEGYEIGNSLTRDSLYKLAGDSTVRTQWAVLEDNGFVTTNPGYHFQFGESLNNIYSNPLGVPITGANLGGQWPTALQSNWDYLSVQPYNGTGSKLSTDIATIQAWANTQPATSPIIIWQVWCPSADFLTNFGTDPALVGSDPDTILQPAYFQALWDALEPIYGNRLRLAPGGEIAYQLHLRALNGDVPGMTDYLDLYRDPTHPSTLGEVLFATVKATVIAGRPLGYDSAAHSTSVTQTFANICADVTREYAASDPRMRVGRLP